MKETKLFLSTQQRTKHKLKNRFANLKEDTDDFLFQAKELLLKKSFPPLLKLKNLILREDFPKSLDHDFKN